MPYSTSGQGFSVSIKIVSSKIMASLTHNMPESWCSPSNVWLFAPRATAREQSFTAPLPVATDKHQWSKSKATEDQGTAEVSEGITFCACLSVEREQLPKTTSPLQPIESGIDIPDCWVPEHDHTRLMRSMLMNRDTLLPYIPDCWRPS